MVSPGREKGGLQLSCSWWGESPVTTSNSTGARGRPAEGGGRKEWVCVKQRYKEAITTAVIRRPQWNVISP